MSYAWGTERGYTARSAEVARNAQAPAEATDSLVQALRMGFVQSFMRRESLSCQQRSAIKAVRVKYRAE